jgi:apolipoprotein N-acyltransferase
MSALWFDRKSPYLFCLSFVALEWVRGWIFTGFPWGLVGHLWLDTHVMQLAAWTGVFPLSFFILWGVWHLKPFIIAVILTLPLLFLPFENTFFDEKVRLVQPNVRQEDKWDYSKEDERFHALMDLSKTKDPKVKAVILPETAFTFFLSDFPQRSFFIQDSIPKDGYFLVGSVRKANQNAENFDLRTSLLALDNNMQILDFYDKTHLVPFGEYLPLHIRTFFPGIAKITHGNRSYTPGSGSKNIFLKGFPSFNPLLCYESIFPEEIVTHDRANFILIITNDAWFGNSVGPKQHLDLARIRAIEQGLGVVRVANTGISGVIDPKGRVLEFIPLGEKGAIDTSIPKPLPQTFYSKYMYLEKYVMYGLWVFLIFMYLRKRLK